MMPTFTRREALGAAISLTALSAHSLAQTATPGPGPVVKSGRLKQSVSRWCYGKIPMPEFCEAVKGMGLTAIDLLQPNEWQVVADHGLVCSMAYAGGGSIRDGLNYKKNHDAIVKGFEENIPKAAALKIPNVITFFGNRMGLADEEAKGNCR